MAKAGCHLLAYLDDYASSAPSKEKAFEDYNNFLATTDRLGLRLAKEKCQAPVRALEWLGFYVDSLNMTVSITKQKLDDLLQECKPWLTRTRISKHNLQSLVGKLVHVSSCISHGRKFTTRLLSTLRRMKDRNWTSLSKDAKLDIKWFINYAGSGNGRSLIAPTTDYFFIECDPCTHGAGGNYPLAFYKWKFSQDHTSRFKNIHSLEAVNLLVAYKTLAPTNHPSKLTVVLLTDNMASAHALMSGRTKDETLGACARQLWLEAALRGHYFIIQHKPGVDIPLADALSQYYVSNSEAALADQQVAERQLLERPPVLAGYTFFATDL